MDDQNPQPNPTPIESLSTPSLPADEVGVDTPQPPVESPRTRYLIAAILILAAIALGSWVWRNQLGSPTSKLAPTSADTNPPDRRAGIEPPTQPINPCPIFDPQLSTSIADITNWKIYSNGEYGFEFKYLDWRIGSTDLEKGGSFQLMNYPDCREGRFLVGENKIEMVIVNETLDQAVKNEKEVARENSFPVRDFSPAMIAGHQSLKGVGSTSVSYIITLDVSGQRVLMATMSGDKNNFEILDKILSTLRFVK